jgi:hypothetical protein
MRARDKVSPSVIRAAALLKRNVRLDSSGRAIPFSTTVLFLSRLGCHFGVIVAVAPNDIQITFLDSDDPVFLSYTLASGHDVASDFAPTMLREIKPGILRNGPIRPAQLAGPCLCDCAVTETYSTLAPITHFLRPIR